MFKIVSILALGIIFLFPATVRPSNDLLQGLKVTVTTPTPTPTPDTNPWVDSFTPLRQFYVSPSGTGNGLTIGAPMNLTTARAQSTSGDRYWLLAGNYGNVTFTVNGTLANPVVWRAYDHQRATFTMITISGAYNWVWDLEVTDPGGSPSGASIGAFATGAHLINNFIRDTWDCGIGGYGEWGPDHVYYGNLVSKVGQNVTPDARCYPLYVASRYSTDGWKYIVQNMLLDAATEVGGPGYNFHGYTQGGFLSGLHTEKNVMRDGQFLLGGFNEPVHHAVIKSNYFYSTGSGLKITFGYARPAVVTFDSNYVGRTRLQDDWFWGANGGGNTNPIYTKSGTNIFTNNRIYNDTLVALRTRAYTSDALTAQGFAPLDPADTVNNNTYYAGVFSFNANGIDYGPVESFATWRSASAAAGNSFDVNSTWQSAAPSTNWVIADANEYETGRGNVTIYNWQLLSSTSVNISSFGLTVGQTYAVKNPKDFYGTNIASGTYSGSNITIPIAGPAEFAAFVVVPGS